MRSIRRQSPQRDRHRKQHRRDAVMPPFKGILSGEEIDAVAHCVVEQIAPKG
jgi:mono/diheme cytochrome c family protein